MGILDALSELCPAATRRRRGRKRPQLTTVEMKVRIDCEGCERKIRKALRGVRGVTAVEVVPKQSKVAVTGYIDDPARVMRRVARKTGKPVEPWPYVPYDVVQPPRPVAYAPGAAYGYDGKAPPAGYVVEPPRPVAYAPGAAYGYEKKAPPGYVVRNAAPPLARASSKESLWMLILFTEGSTLIIHLKMDSLPIQLKHLVMEGLGLLPTVVDMGNTSDTRANFGSGVPTGDTIPTEDSGSDGEVQSTPEGFTPRTPFVGMKCSP